MGLLLHPIVCLFVCLSVYLSVVLTACLPVRPAAQLWALSDKTPVNAFDMWRENFVSITMAMEAVQTRRQFWIWEIRIWVRAAVICKHGAMGPVIALAYRGFCLCRQCFGYVRLWVVSPPKQQGIYQSTGVCSYVQKHVIGCVSLASPGVSRL